MLQAFLEDLGLFREALSNDDVFTAEAVASDLRLRYPVICFKQADSLGHTVPAYDTTASVFWDAPVYLQSVISADRQLREQGSRVGIA